MKQKNFIEQLQIEVREQQEAAQQAQEIANYEYKQACKHETLAEENAAAKVPAASTAIADRPTIQFRGSSPHGQEDPHRNLKPAKLPQFWHLCPGLPLLTNPPLLQLHLGRSLTLLEWRVAAISFVSCLTSHAEFRQDCCGVDCIVFVSSFAWDV